MLFAGALGFRVWGLGFRAYGGAGQESSIFGLHRWDRIAHHAEPQISGFLEPRDSDTHVPAWRSEDSKASNPNSRTA